MLNFKDAIIEKNGFSYRVNFAIKEDANVILVASHLQLSKIFSEKDLLTCTIKTASDLNIMCYDVTFLEELLISNSLFLVFKIKNNYISTPSLIERVYCISENNDKVFGDLQFDKEKNIYIFSTSEKFHCSKLKLIFTFLFAKKNLNFNVIYFEDSLFSNKRNFYLSLC